jgi:nucleotide-binding universal stress UspA family protein
MEIKRILWPTDLSSNAETALGAVTSLSIKYKAEIHILYVIEDLGIHESWYGVFETEHIEKIHEWEEKQALKRLDQICEEYLNECPLYIRHVLIGDPTEQILKLISKENIDMVVMATRGRRANFSFGSVTEKVSKNSPVPVVTVPV